MNKKTLIQHIAIVLVFFIGSTLLQAQESSVIKMAATSPYQEDHDIRNNILNECTSLGKKLASFTQSYARKRNIEIDLVDSIDTSDQGRVLQVEISHAVSQGNPFIGHRKFVEISGTLWQDGEAIASFDGQRASGGGFAAGYKSSCSVLGRCVKTLGKDIAAWLSNPVDGASIGQ